MTRTKYLLPLIVALFGILLSGSRAWAQPSVTAVIYVRSGNSTLDTSSINSLTTMVVGLNKGGASIGREYELVKLDTFADAKNYTSSDARDVHGNPYTQAIGVYHGVFDDGDYTGNVKDNDPDHPDATPDTEVDPFFTQAYHCNADGTISTTDIANALADYNSHTYTASTTSGGTSAGSVGGHAGTWSLHSYDVDYAWNEMRDGILVYHYMVGTEYVWVFTYNSSPPGGVSYEV